MRDIQNEPDDRRIPIAKAGIKHLQYPIVVLDRENKRQPTVADVSLYVDLPHNQPLGAEMIEDGGFGEPIEFDGKRWTLATGEAKAEAATSQGRLVVTVARDGNE